MNCLNCGAPTKPVAGRNYFLCTYCETHRLPSFEQTTADGVVASHEFTEIECPQCAGESLVIAALDGIEVEHCTCCQGILLGNERFRSLLQRRRKNYQGSDDKPIPLDASELDRQTQCPQCGGRMAVHPYHGPGNAVVDTCFPCRIIWLDHGEFAALERAPGLRR